MRISRMMFVFASLMLAAACAPRPAAGTPSPVAPTLDLGQIVQATLAAMTAQATTLPPTGTALPPTPASSTGSIAGSLNYPADRLPALYVVAYRAGSENYQSITTSAGQSSFTISKLQPGTYHVIAYTVGGDGFPAGLAGGYTKAVACGLATECADHSLVDVVVSGGQTSSGVKVHDWNASPGTFPPFPGQAPVSTATAAADTGGIAGDLMYPASALPALRIVAFRVGSTTSFFYVDTAPGQSHYQLDNVTPGTYHVVAYVIPGGGFTGGLAGGYTQMVPCGLQSGCNDHALLDVVVSAGQVTTGVNPNDYYASPGTFPPEPQP